MPVGRRSADAQGFGGLLDRQTGEVAELDELGLFGVFFGELGQGVVEGDQVVGRGGEGEAGLVEVDAAEAAAAFGSGAAAGLLDEDSAHGLGGGGEEMPAAVPVLDARRVDEADVGFVDE